MNFINRILNNKELEKPYYDLYGETLTHLEYPDLMMHEMIYESSKKYAHSNAISYYGKSLTYKKFYEKIETCAKALKANGVKEGDRITICMPNTPEAVIAFYAINMVGAVASMIHPLSSENEIEFYMDSANSKFIFTVNVFEEKVITAARRVNAKKIIIADVTDSMFIVIKKTIEAYNYVTKFFKEKENKEYLNDDNVMTFKKFFDTGYGYDGKYKVTGKSDKEAVILYSGGTTGKPKGVVLSNKNFNAEGMQCFAMTGAKAGESVLTIMPIFHGFGLGVSVHTELISGMKCILIPAFKVSEFARLIKLYRPSFLIGVPTMYEALINNEDKSKYLKCVTNCICGGDTLKTDLRERVNAYLLAHGSNAQIRVGYGLTESTAAAILTPKHYFKEGALGVPFPDVTVKIIKPGTTKEQRKKREGEICISGPTVMLGYLNETEETANTLKLHPDGKIYLHTGDIGYKDEEGLVFFTSRLKRMIVTSGYNVYPSYLEKIIDSHPAVLACVVVGIPHPYKKQVPVACIVLRDNFKESKELTNDIKYYCAKSIAKYAMPYRYHYIKSVPKTLIGKVNYKKLQEECTKKYSKEA